MQEIIPPFTLKYDGNDADRHEMDAYQYGLSVLGAAKIYNSVAHYCVTGIVPSGNYRKQISCYTRAPKESSFANEFYLVVTAQQYGLFNEVIKKSLSFLFFKFSGIIKDFWVGKSTKDEFVEKLAEAIIKRSEKDHDLMELLINGLLADNKRLSDLHEKLIITLPELAEKTRKSARDLVTPVGSSCKELTQFSGTDNGSKIDEADAEAIRSTEDLEVKDMQTFRCEKIQELNISTGHCELKIEGIEGIVKGKISDPALETPHNVYTKALDGQLPFDFQAKPVERKGRIQKLFISDASL